MSNTINVRTSQGVQPAELIAENPKTVWVKLPDGRVIQRNRKKHIVAAVVAE
jgi:hypothetical protein